MKALKPAEFRMLATAAGISGAVLLLGGLFLLGRQYTSECRKAGGDFDQCWQGGLAISGVGAGGPLSAGVVVGYILGMIGKEREKQEKFQEGYWTLNPDLRRNDDLG